MWKSPRPMTTPRLLTSCSRGIGTCSRFMPSRLIATTLSKGSSQRATMKAEVPRYTRLATRRPNPPSPAAGAARAFPPRRALARVRAIHGALALAPSSVLPLRLLDRTAPGDSDENIVQPRSKQEQSREQGHEQDYVLRAFLHHERLF